MVTISTLVELRATVLSGRSASEGRSGGEEIQYIGMSMNRFVRPRYLLK